MSMTPKLKAHVKALAAKGKAKVDKKMRVKKRYNPQTRKVETKRMPASAMPKSTGVDPIKPEGKFEKSTGEIMGPMGDTAKVGTLKARRLRAASKKRMAEQAKEK